MAPLFVFLSFFISLCASVSLPPNIYSRQAPTLKPGSWLITYKPSAADSQTYRGPLRITSSSDSTFISGDLYNGTTEANPADGSPILPRANYWAFVRPTKLTSGSNGGFSLDLGFWEFKRFEKKVRYWDTVWADAATDGGYTVDFTPATPPSGYPDSENYFEGDVKNTQGNSVGRFTMGWVSEYLRRVELEIGTVSGLEVPLSDTSGTRDWKAIFADAGYDITVTVGKTDIEEPTNPQGPGYWTNEQEHQAVLEHRSPTDLDKQWKYYLLVVRRIVEVERGAMIDEGREYNEVPREGTCIASEWIVGTLADGSPDTSEDWPASVTGKKFYEVHDAWYRTAVHEVGHFFNLGHPPQWNDDVMTDTLTIVRAGTTGESPELFPENIKPQTFRFIPQDIFKMQHRPDTHLRPGYVDFGAPAPDNTPPVVPNLNGSPTQMKVGQADGEVPTTENC